MVPMVTWLTRVHYNIKCKQEYSVIGIILGVYIPRFNKVFEQTTTQDEIFEKVAREVADK